MQAIEAFSAIKRRAEEIKNNQTHRFPAAASPGDYWRQGDIYITLLERLPKRAKKADKVDRQLAPGNTRGSRHVLSHGNVTMYTVSGNALLGPVIEVKRQVTVTHPDHGNVVLPSGIYSITYQRAFADELKRVQD